MGGRPRRRLHGRPGGLRAGRGLRARESQGRRDQRRHHGQVEQGPAGPPGALREDKRKENEKKEVVREARRRARSSWRTERRSTPCSSRSSTATPAWRTSGRAKAPISSGAIREIPFEWDSEAITHLPRSDDRQGFAPAALMAAKFADERNALHAAVQPRSRKTPRGASPRRPVKHINDVDRQLPDQVPQEQRPSSTWAMRRPSPTSRPMASLNRLLGDPSMKAFLAQLDDRARSGPSAS